MHGLQPAFSNVVHAHFVLLHHKDVQLVVVYEGLYWVEIFRTLLRAGLVSTSFSLVAIHLVRVGLEEALAEDPEDVVREHEDTCSLQLLLTCDILDADKCDDVPETY